MQLIDTTSWTEMRSYLLQAFNEVLNGFRVDFPTQLQTSRERVVALDKKLDAVSTERMLFAEEISLLIAICLLCEHELGQFEFSTRMGYTLDESRHFIERLRQSATISSIERHAAAS